MFMFFTRFKLKKKQTKKHNIPQNDCIIHEQHENTNIHEQHENTNIFCAKETNRRAAA
jgi:hypothetical protein